MIKISKPQPGTMVLEIPGKDPVSIPCSGPTDYEAVHRAVEAINDAITPPVAKAASSVDTGDAAPPRAKTLPPKGEHKGTP